MSDCAYYKASIDFATEEENPFAYIRDYSVLFFLVENNSFSSFYKSYKMNRIFVIFVSFLFITTHMFVVSEILNLGVKLNETHDIRYVYFMEKIRRKLSTSTFRYFPHMLHHVGRNI